MTRGERRPAPKSRGKKGSTGSGRAARGRARVARAAAGRAGSSRKAPARPAPARPGRPGPGRGGAGRAEASDVLDDGSAASVEAGFGRSAPDRAAVGRVAPGRKAPGRKAPGGAGPGRKGPGRAAPGRRRSAEVITEAGYSKEPELRATPKSAATQRVQKVLARAGLGSRRKAETLIAEGRVRIDGKRVNKQGVLVNPRRAAVSVDGRRISAEPLEYLVFHKPREVMCTMSDPLGRRSVVDYLRGMKAHVVPVGRLDYQTSGVLLLTNDGDFARELLHPSRGVQKEYVLKLKGAVDGAGLQRLRERIDIAGKQTKAARVERLRADDNNTWLVVTLQEGKNRQVRRLAEYAGYRVMRLTRTRFAGLTTEGLLPGQWRELSASEVRSVRGQSSPEAAAAAVEKQQRKRR